MPNKILNLFYQKPTIIFLILTFSIYLDTSGFTIATIEFHITNSLELIPYFIFKLKLLYTLCRSALKPTGQDFLIRV